MPISRPLSRMIKSLPTAKNPKYGYPVVPEFGVVFDTHQDHAGRQQFYKPDRGKCAPVLVDFDPASLKLVHHQTGTWVPIDDRANFMTVEAWRAFVLQYAIEHGSTPLDSNGWLQTSLVRDARRSLHLFKSFRQIVVHNYKKGGSGTGSTP